MSGPEIAVVAVGVLAVVAVLGVVVLLVQTRRLRAELASVATSARQQPTPLAPAAEPLRPDPRPSREVVRREPDAVVVAPSQEQIVVATLGHPLVRVAALSHGVRRALTPENRDRIAALVRRDLRRREKLRRRAARRAARVLPVGASDLSVAPAARTSEDPSGAGRRDLAS